MKRTTIAALVISLVASSAALADSVKGRGQDAEKQRHFDTRHDDRQDRRDDRSDRRDDRWDRRDDRRDDRWDRRDDRRDWRYAHPRVRAIAYRHPHGYRPHYWRHGERLPVAYYARPYVIRDYRGCNLRTPPRGYHWVRVDQDVVLAAIATGIVLDVLYNHFY